MKGTRQMDTHKTLRILCADQSQRCPGFACLRYENGRVIVESLCHLNNQGKKKSHGQMLHEIHELLEKLSVGIDVFVREKGFSRFPNETQALFKVVGIADLTAWQYGHREFHEIAPTTVKKAQTGSGKAAKEEVAASLIPYVGNQIYAKDDESDAVAVHVAWLLQNDLIGGVE